MFSNVSFRKEMAFNEIGLWNSKEGGGPFP